MRERVLMRPGELAAALPAGPLVLDVTVDLKPARFDGDYRVRSGREGWLRGHVPGSAHVDLLTEFTEPGRAYHFARPSADAIADGLARLGAGPGRGIVVYDEGRMQWAARAWWMLRCAGVEARILDGGLAAWTAEGHRVETVSSGQPDPATGPVTGAGYDGWADRDEVSAISVGNRPGTLVCALSSDQFDGSSPTRYARRGHIPGSRNLPSSAMLSAEDHTVLPDRNVADAAASSLAGADSPVVVYCGGGISACVTALGLTLAGYPGVKVYDGSLEEWTADPSLPVAVGR